MPEQIVEQAVAVTPQEAAAVRRVAVAQGRLVSMTRLHQLSDGRVAYLLRLRAEPVTPMASSPLVVPTAGEGSGLRKRWHPALLAAGTAAGAVTIAGAGWGLYLGWLWLVAHRNGVVGSLLLAALILYLLRRSN